MHHIQTVLKFGGTSVGSPPAIRQVVQIVKQVQGKHPTARVAVVCSAFGGTTDQLITMSKLAAAGDKSYRKLYRAWQLRHAAAINELLHGTTRDRVINHLERRAKHLAELLSGVFLVKEVSPRTLDLIVSFGERISNYSVAAVFRQNHIKAEYLDAREVLRTDDHFGSARVDEAISYQAIQKYFQEHTDAVQVITGYVGSTVDGLTTTLGRGGSDYTAALFGAALKVAEVQIWTDVDGVMTADPRLVLQASLVDSMSYHEAMELSHFGAKVIYAPTMFPVMEKKIPLRIKNTFNPDCAGTVITAHPQKTQQLIRGISLMNDIAVVRMEGTGMVGHDGIAARIFSALAQAQVSAILITQASSEHSICIAVTPNSAERAKQAIDAEFKWDIRDKRILPAVLERNKAIVAAVGEKVRSTPGIAGKVFNSLGKDKINAVAIAQGSSELNLSVVVEKADAPKAIRSIHNTFFIEQPKTVQVYLVGTGLIGSTLMEQIITKQAELFRQDGIQVRIMAVANSKKLLISTQPLVLKNWRAQLQASNTVMSLPSLVALMRQAALPHSIFVDCTADEIITQYYEEILNSGVAIVTPNKKANSGSYKQYQALQHAAKSRQVDYLYETNVGAGLPIIRSLKDLVASGDNIYKIEAVLSGTLSFIFNSYDGQEPFSAVVKQAKALGYTEPDPRDDLRGMDVARKLLILVRETRQALELKDVIIQSLVPKVCAKAKSVDEFMSLLPKADAEFARLQQPAARAGKVLRYIATFAHGKASIALQAVGPEHPFYRLSGSDNIVAFTTKRYQQRPLVIQGPGAGAEVTAAGVFANIIRIANKVII
ncbi:MAG: hypothetical protein ACD_43C00138G0003 [uncultured bacterium]|nr:MAG: hypothetical protein ACD_43C00138G0003 [uncultured bacterium]